MLVRGTDGGVSGLWLLSGLWWRRRAVGGTALEEALPEYRGLKGDEEDPKVGRLQTFVPQKQSWTAPAFQRLWGGSLGGFWKPDRAGVSA